MPSTTFDPAKLVQNVNELDRLAHDLKHVYNQEKYNRLLELLELLNIPAEFTCTCPTMPKIMKTPFHDPAPWLEAAEDFEHTNVPRNVGICYAVSEHVDFVERVLLGDYYEIIHGIMIDAKPSFDFGDQPSQTTRSGDYWWPCHPNYYAVRARFCRHVAAWLAGTQAA